MLKNYTKIEVDENGAKNYLNDERKLHRLDGPAIEYSVGSKFWYINGNYHRNIDPSGEFSDGEKNWSFKREQHRVGGSYYSYREYWRINDEEYTKKEYINIVWDI